MSTRCVVVCCLYAIGLMVPVVTSGQTTQPANLIVNTAVRHQTIEGFGTALANLSPTFSSTMQNLYAQDMGFSILRLPLLPEVLPGRIRFGPDLQTNINLINFNTYPQSGWGGVFAQAVTAQRIDQMKIIATVWSPPAWMKTSNSENGGALIQTPDNLQQYARYLAAYVVGFQQAYHVPLYAISLQNELRFSEPYPSTIYNPTQYVATLKAVGAEFARDGITTKIFGPEDVGVDSGFLTANQMSFINAVKADPVANQYLNILAVHGYAGNGSSPGSDASNWADYWSRIQNDGRESWMTEESGENPAWLHYDSTGKPDGALSVALRVHQGLAYGNLNAWVYWQFDDGKPISNYTLESGGDTTSLKYNAFKHYSRFIRPGDVRVDAGPDNSSGLNVDAWVDDAHHLLTINLENISAYNTPTTISIPGTDFGSFAEYLTDGTHPWEVLPDVMARGGAVTLMIPPSSVITLQSDSIIGQIPEPGSIGVLVAAILFLRRARCR